MPLQRESEEVTHRIVNALVLSVFILFLVGAWFRFLPTIRSAQVKAEDDGVQQVRSLRPVDSDYPVIKMCDEGDGLNRYVLYVNRAGGIAVRPATHGECR